MTISVIFITVDTYKNSKKIIKKLLDKKLAACINEIRGITSHYWWKGKIEKGKEILLIIKTKKKNVKKIIETIEKIHPYTVPEIISFDIKEGNNNYIKWIYEVTK